MIQSLRIAFVSLSKVPSFPMTIRSIADLRPTANICRTRLFHSSPKAENSKSDLASCSSRGENAVRMLPVYLTDARAVQRYDPEKYPNGALQLSVAENYMLEDLIVPSISKFSQSSDTGNENNFHPDQIYYQATHGREELLSAFAQYFHKLFELPDCSSLDEDGLVVGAGCNAVLENLAFCLADAGDSVLIPTPYYAAFEFDLVARAGLDIIPVNTFHDNQFDGKKVPPEAYFPTKATLDSAYNQALKENKRPKILLLSHPNNPLGICYPESTILECVQWARDNKVHLISDEIYCGSVYKNPTFQSVLKLAANKQPSPQPGLGLGPYIHFVYALSKDFALSGLRVGALYSENTSIRLPLRKLNDLCQVSSQTQLLVERMLKDQTWTRNFLSQSQMRLLSRSQRLMKCLDDLDIPYLDGEAGMFLWMDWSQFLPPLQQTTNSEIDKDQRERKLYLELLKEHGLLFTPGRSMKNVKPGFFRCVFTAATDQEFDLALERIQKFVMARRNEGQCRD